MNRRHDAVGLSGQDPVHRQGRQMFFAAGMGKPMMGSRSDLTHSFVVGNVRFLRI
jgi:hypothetical protein